MTQHFPDMVRVFTGVMLCVMLLPSVARAHDGLQEQIVAVTAKIKRDPKNASLYLQRGELHRLRREWVRAAADYDRAARLQPSLTIVDLARGKMLFESRRLQQARAVLDRFLRHQPEDVEGLLTRARVLAGIGNHVQAARDFTQALALAPTPEPEIYLERAQVLAANADLIEEALRGLDEGIHRLGPIVTLQLTAIDLEVRRGNYDAALTRLDTIAAQSERKEMWLVRRGEILRSAGRIQEAEASFNSALAAIESLPPERRQSRAVAGLRARCSLHRRD